MNKLVVYDSRFGNTRKVALAIAKGISGRAVSVSEIKKTELLDLDVLIVGSPTQGGRPTIQIQQFLENLDSGSLKDTKIAAFDTRFSVEESSFPLNLIIKFFGYAAPKIAFLLESAGGKLIAKPEGFIVKGKEGPISLSEIKRASTWIENMVE